MYVVKMRGGYLCANGGPTKHLKYSCINSPSSVVLEFSDLLIVFFFICNYSEPCKMEENCESCLHE